ncbi:hypothetical protein KKF55_02450 [Patescibacteria group bacterium]|nr:hypothetical protein [Patescibacteria group bacterium]
MGIDSIPAKPPSTPAGILNAVKDAKDQLAAIRTILFAEECSVNAIDMARYLRNKNWSAQQTVEVLQYLGDNAKIYRTMVSAGYDADESRDIIIKRATGLVEPDDIRSNVRKKLSSALDDVDKEMQSAQE